MKRKRRIVLGRTSKKVASNGKPPRGWPVPPDGDFDMWEFIGMVCDDANENRIQNYLSEEARAMKMSQRLNSIRKEALQDTDSERFTPKKLKDKKARRRKGD